MTDIATAPPAQTAAAPGKWWRGKAPAAPSPGATLRSTVVGVAGLLALVAIGKLFHSTLLTPPLAATAVIIAGAPASAPAAPRSVLGGHLLSAALGFLVAAGLGSSPWTAGLAGGLSLGVMALTRTVHAPAAATAALIVAQHPAVLRTLDPLAVGCALLIAIGWIAGRLFRAARYPGYWW